MDLPGPENESQSQSTHRKRRRAKRRAIMKQVWSDYTKSTSIHCLKYTTETSFRYIERIFWIVTFSLSLGMCLWLIRNVWHKWEASPVIVSFSEKLVPVEFVPFPSLTICPQIKARASEYNYTKYFNMVYNTGTFLFPDDEYDLNSNSSDRNKTRNIMTAEEFKRFQDISLICPLPYYMEDIDLSMIPGLGLNVTNSSSIDEIIRVSPDLTYFDQCFWLGVEKRCSDLFKEVLTGEGVCFNFNGLAADEIFRAENIQKDYIYSNVSNSSVGWDINIGYNNSDDADYFQQYPYRGQYTSHRPYLEVILMTPKEDYDGYCNVINKGFKVYTQHPASHPQSSVYSYAILPKQLSALALKVNMINTSEKLQGYDPEVRQCFFANEKYLKYFKLYTTSNCMFECMSNFTFQMCKCVPFHMPHSDSRSICALQKTKCLAKTRASNRRLMEFIEDCNCLPSCNSITYEAEILKTKFDLEKSITNLFKMSGLNEAAETVTGTEFSKLEVYYRDSGFITITRSELFGITDFLANIGGLLGLFMGFSFLSLIEIVYFFSVRLGITCKGGIKTEKDGINSRPDSSSTNTDKADTATTKAKHI